MNPLKFYFLWTDIIFLGLIEMYIVIDVFLTIAFQLRTLKERSKTEMFRSRGQRAGHVGRSPWCGSKKIGLKRSAPLKREFHFEQGKNFQDMLDNVGGFSAKKEQSVVSDCEDYFSDA